MGRSAMDAVIEHLKQMNRIADLCRPSEIDLALLRDRQLVDGFFGSATAQAVRDAQLHSLQFDLGTTHLQAMQDLMPRLTQLPEHISAMQGFNAELQRARSYLEGSTGFLFHARDSLDAFLRSIYSDSDAWLRDPARWIDEEIDRLLTDTPKYRRSKLAWILVMFVPRFRLALHEQDAEGDFDGVMQILWEDLFEDPEVRARLRDRLKKSGVREELRQSLSSHLDKLEAGEFMYAIMGLYAHIEGFLAEIAVERKLIPDAESILRPDGTKRRRSGVQELIEALYKQGQLDDSQKEFLNFVLSNSYQANRVRHGVSFEFTQERAVALALALVLVLCLSWGVEPDELLEAGEAADAEDLDRSLDEILNDD